MDNELENELIKIERQLWSARGDSKIFDKYLSTAFHFNVSYEDGYYNKKLFTEKASVAPLWKSVLIDDYEFTSLSPAMALVTYEVEAEYETGGFYNVGVISVYSKEGGIWKVLLHNHYF